MARRKKNPEHPNLLVSGEQLRRFYGELDLEAMSGELIERENPGTRDNSLLHVKRIRASVLMPQLEKFARGLDRARGWKRNCEKHEAQKARETQKIRETNAEAIKAEAAT